jgi:prepilin peptidase CpaA
MLAGMVHVLLSAAALAFPALVILGGIADLASYRIPNWISLALAAAFVPAAALAWATGASPAALGIDLAVGAGALAAGMAMFALGSVGGGDAKLLAATALWLGWPAVGTFLLATALTGGLLAGLLLVLRSAALRPIAATGPGWVARLAEPGEGVPYGAAIAVGALAAFPISAIAHAAQGL